MAERERLGSLVPPPGWLAPDEHRRERRLGLMFGVLVTLLALVVRLHDLGRHSLWIDEYLTWSLVRPGLHFWEQVRDAYQGPLYHALIWPLARTEPVEWMLRLPSALAGAATVPLLGLLAARLYGTSCGRYAALLLALSPFHVWYSQEARGYALAILLTVAATVVLLRAARSGIGAGRAAAFAALSAAAALSHWSALLVWAGQAAGVLLLVRPRAWRERWLWLAALAAAPLLAAPWLLKASGILAVGRLAPGAAAGEALRGETTFTWWALPFAAMNLVFGSSLGPGLRELHSPDRLAAVAASLPILLPAALVAATAVAIGLVRLQRRWELLIWLAVPLAVVLLLSWRNVKPFNPRYLACALPFLLVLAARGVTVLPRRWGAALGTLLVALFLVSLAGHFLSPRYWKADARGAAVVVTAAARPDEPILAPVVGPLFAFYYRGEGTVRPCWDWPRLQSEQEALAAVREAAGTARCGWLVLIRSWTVDPRDLLPRALTDAGWLVGTVELPGARVLRWCRPAAGRGDDAADEPDPAAF